MATYLLDGNGTAHLPRRPLSISVSVSGRHRSGVRLAARLARGDEAPVRVHSPAMIIVPRVDEEIIISAVPDSGRAQFDEDTVLHVTIGPDSHDDPDADYAQLAPREVSGLTTIELASIAPAGLEQVAVTTRLAVADTTLTPLASRARVACRGALGVDALPPQQQVNVQCIIDTSTSMATHVADGTLAGAVDVVAGITAVTADRNPLRIVFADPHLTEVPAPSLADVSQRLEESINLAGFGIGADIDAALSRLSGAATFTIVITDNLTQRQTVTQSAAVSWLVLASTAQRPAGFTGTVFAPPATGLDARAYYDSNPHLVDSAVAELVAPLRQRLVS